MIWQIICSRIQWSQNSEETFETTWTSPSTEWVLSGWWNLVHRLLQTNFRNIPASVAPSCYVVQTSISWRAWESQTKLSRYHSWGQRWEDEQLSEVSIDTNGLELWHELSFKIENIAGKVHLKLDLTYYLLCCCPLMCCFTDCFLLFWPFVFNNLSCTALFESSQKRESNQGGDGPKQRCWFP